jgi:CBS domain-containing protein
MKTEVPVREVMDREYVGATESDDLVDTVELLLREDAETAVVLRGSEPVGVLTERDVLAILVEGPAPETATVGDAMTESIPTVSPETSLDAAADMMSAQSARRLVVTNGGEPLGLLTEHDLLTTRTHNPDADIEEQAASAVGSGAGTALAAETETEATDSFEDQGICEVCGTFNRELTSFNGQLLCADCRDM